MLRTLRLRFDDDVNAAVSLAAERGSISPASIPLQDDVVGVLDLLAGQIVDANVAFAVPTERFTPWEQT